jgi:hypothetical protein
MQSDTATTLGAYQRHKTELLLDSAIEMNHELARRVNRTAVGWIRLQHDRMSKGSCREASHDKQHGANHDEMLETCVTHELSFHDHLVMGRIATIAR